MREYKVEFEIFEGPLDLLLYLVRKQEVDIYGVNLTRLATDFVGCVERMKEFDLDLAGEFLVMSAHLMYIKSRGLLPVERQVEAEEEREETDPRWELIRQLVEYKKFKDVASGLQDRETTQFCVFPRVPVEKNEGAGLPPSGLQAGDASVGDLIHAVNQVLRRYRERETGRREIYAERFTVSEKLEYLLDLLLRVGRIRFSELLNLSRSRIEVVVTFLALLELIRLRKLVIFQAHPFVEIEIECAPALTVEVGAGMGKTAA